MDIHDRIKHAREEKGWSQQQLADKVGVSRVAVTKWESGQTANLKLANLIRLCELFKIEPTELITGKQREPFKLKSADNANDIYAFGEQLEKIIELIRPLEPYQQEALYQPIKEYIKMYMNKPLAESTEPTARSPRRRAS